MVGAEQLPQHLADQGDGDGRRVVGDLARQLARGREQRVRRDDATHQAPGQGLLGGEHASRQRPLGRLTHADEARQEPRAARLGHDAAAGEHETDAGRGGRDAHVHGQRQRDAEADGRSVDRRDDRLLEVDDAQRHASAAVTMLVRGRAVGAIERPAAGAEVGARAERAAGAGDDHRPHAIVGIRRVERGDELVDRARGDGVEAVGTVQRDRRDGVGDVVQDLLVGHGALPRAILPDMSEAADAIEQLHARGVTDGLPVVPPTRALVDAMIAASDRRADELIASVAPANGRATIEKIAINAVMAGCRPEYMPVVVAAVRAMCDDAFDLVGISATTDAVAPIFLLNGPVLATITRTLEVVGNHTLRNLGDVLIVFAPEHAQVIGDDGWSKADVRDYLWERLRGKFRAPENFRLLVAGGTAGRFTALIPGWPFPNAPTALVLKKIG